MRNIETYNSRRLYKDGFRYLQNGEAVQRWLCRECGYRFSSGHKVSKNRKHNINTRARQKAIVLAEVIGKKEDEAAGATKTKFDSATAKGLLLQYEFWLQKEGYAQKCRYVDCIRMLINSGANLLDPEHVKTVIAKKKWKNGTKMQAVYAYDALAKMLNIKWEKPRYRQEEALPWIPQERELDALILGARNKRLAAFLQTLKETFADPSEALRLEWTDIRGNVITINKPVRGHNPREIQVSNRLIAMLNSLPKKSKRIFPVHYHSMATAFYKLRKRVARTLQNPRIEKISFTTFRHFGATKTYHMTRNILLVKKLLGHKKIENTMKYTQLIDFQESEYEVATATTDEDIKKLGAAGWVKYDERKIGETIISYYRKPKRFQG